MGDDAQMRTYLASLPRWALALISGLPFGTAMGIFTKIDGSSTVAAFVSGAVVGILFAASLTFSLKRRWRGEQRALGDAPPAIQKAALGAVWRGPAPADPEIRAATLRLAEHQLGQMLRWRTTIIICFAVVLVGTVVSAFDSSWRLVFTALYVPLLVGQWYWPKHLCSRIELLSGTASTKDS
ncbi:MAG: hypothetical protein QOG10_3733 [Kribbellaceae bacterium]|nr:hypothetical protein [Kribbellaceae bacterium]